MISLKSMNIPWILRRRQTMRRKRKIPAILALSFKIKTRFMSRFEISQKSRGLLLREVGSRHFFVVKTVDATTVLCFTQNADMLKVETASSGDVNFITDFECYGIMGLYRLSGGMHSVCIISASPLFRGHHGSCRDRY